MENIQPKSEGGAAPAEAASAGASRPTPPGLRRLDLGEMIRQGDLVWPYRTTAATMKESICDGVEVEEEDVGYYYRRLPPEAPKGPAERSEAEQSSLDGTEAEPSSLTLMYRDNGESAWWSVVELPARGLHKDGETFTFKAEGK